MEMAFVLDVKDDGLTVMILSFLTDRPGQTMQTRGAV